METSAATPAAFSAEEQQFRDDSMRHSFKGSLYNALSGAAFIGVLVKLSNLLIDTFSPDAEVSKVAVDTFTHSPGGMAAMAGMMAVGTAFTYFAQKEWTELKCIQDERLARKNAEMMSMQHELEMEKAQAVARGVAQEVKAEVKAGVEEAREHGCQEHYPQNERSDGKSWQAVIASARNDLMHGLGFN